MTQLAEQMRGYPSEWSVSSVTLGTACSVERGQLLVISGSSESTQLVVAVTDSVTLTVVPYTRWNRIKYGLKWAWEKDPVFVILAAAAGVTMTWVAVEGVRLYLEAVVG